MEIEKELLEYKDKIEKAKQKKAVSQGKIQHMEEEIKTLLDCSSLDTAKDKLIEMQEEINKIREELEQGREELTKIPELN